MIPPTPFTPYAVAIGEVIAHEPRAYVVRLPSGEVTAIPAAGEPSPEAFAADYATPPAPAHATPAEIKAEAQRRILLIAPAWKQSNLIARVLELTRDHGTDVSTWPPEAQAENTAAQIIWEKIKALRLHSDVLEATPPALADLPTAGWPY